MALRQWSQGGAASAAAAVHEWQWPLTSERELELDSEVETRPRPTEPAAQRAPLFFVATTGPREVLVPALSASARGRGPLEGKESGKLQVELEERPAGTGAR